jgi:protein-tyrosine-phosphatase
MAEAQGGRADTEPTTYNILFVCTGNTCRSPLSEVLAKHALRERGWDHVRVQSAGIAAQPGGGASEQARAVAAARGLDLESHVTRQLGPELVAWADLILGMGPSHLFAVAELDGEFKSALITDALGDDAAGASIDDPFGGGVEEYERTAAQLEAAISALLERLEPILSP